MGGNGANQKTVMLASTVGLIFLGAYLIKRHKSKLEDKK